MDDISALVSLPHRSYFHNLVAMNKKTLSYVNNVNVFLRKIPDGRYVDVRKPSTFVNFRPHEETAFIVHGFNGTARDKHMRYLKDGNC